MAGPWCTAHPTECGGVKEVICDHMPTSIICTGNIPAGAATIVDSVLKFVFDVLTFVDAKVREGLGNATPHASSYTYGYRVRRY